jgi:hypothetical protein
MHDAAEREGEAGENSGRGEVCGPPTRRHRTHRCRTRCPSTAWPRTAAARVGISLSMNSAPDVGRAYRLCRAVNEEGGEAASRRQRTEGRRGRSPGSLERMSPMAPRRRNRRRTTSVVPPGPGSCCANDLRQRHGLLRQPQTVRLAPTAHVHPVVPNEIRSASAMAHGRGSNISGERSRGAARVPPTPAPSTARARAYQWGVYLPRALVPWLQPVHVGTSASRQATTSAATRVGAVAKLLALRRALAAPCASLPTAPWAGHTTRP